MDSKRKLIIAVSAVVMVVLAAIIAVVAVLAAQNATINSGITINYNPNGVVGAVVKAQYKVGNDGTDTWIGSENGITFTGSETTGSNSTLGDATIDNLSAGQAFVTFTFSFENTGANDFTAELIYEDNSTRDENMTISYTGDAGEVAVKVEDMTYVSDDLYNIGLGSVEVPASSSATYVVKVSVTSEANVAHFSGNFNWRLVAATTT